MGHRWARWTLLVVAIAAAVAACGFALDLEQRLRDVRAGIGTVEARASTARVAMNDVRRALAAPRRERPADVKTYFKAILGRRIDGEVARPRITIPPIVSSGDPYA